MIGALGNSLDSANTAVSTALGRLSSGLRINSAKDDPAGLQIATRMAAQISSTGAALSNVSDASSLAQTAGGALGQVSETLQRMRELAVQAGNGSYSASDRQALQAEFTQLSSSLDSTASQSQFNGKNLLDGTFQATVQTGPNASDTQSLSLGNVSSTALGSAGLDISSAAGATNALSAIDQAISVVAGQQANLGAIQSTLDATSANLANSSVNLSASRAAITDTDYAQTSSDQSLAKVRQQVALKAVALYNANQASVLSLLPGQSK